MNYDQIAFHLEYSTSIRLLRSEHASLALSFFHHTFKKTHRAQIPLNELKQLLTQYLQDLIEQNSNGNNNHGDGLKKFSYSSDHYLNLWCNENHRFIRKYFDYESDTPIVELTYDTERALEWTENLEKKEFVGTHSRFSIIFENLQTIASEVDITPGTRLKYLEGKVIMADEKIRMPQIIFSSTQVAIGI